MRNALTKLLKEAKPVLDRVRRDEDGTALLEYTVLLGILVVAVIAIIVAVGGWISTQWSGLNGAI